MKHHSSYMLRRLITEFAFLTHVLLPRTIPVVLGKPPKDDVSLHEVCLNTHGWARRPPSDFPASSAYPNHNIRLNCLLIFLSVPQDCKLLEGREFGLVYISVLNICSLNDLQPLSLTMHAPCWLDAISFI